jgi:hypothetical protein
MSTTKTTVMRPRKPGGRPATGQVPVAQRQRDAKAALERAGGRRMSLNVTPKAAADLERIRLEHPDLSDTAMIMRAIHWYAFRRSRDPGRLA